jgi:hypothetical protein
MVSAPQSFMGIKTPQRRWEYRAGKKIKAVI